MVLEFWRGGGAGNCLLHMLADWNGPGIPAAGIEWQGLIVTSQLPSHCTFLDDLDIESCIK